MSDPFEDLPRGRGKPKRLNADVRQGIIAPRREHSRKPDGIHERIERLVAGPYLELFVRQSTRPSWTFWGNEAEKFNGIPRGGSGTARKAPSANSGQVQEPVEHSSPSDPYNDGWPDAKANSMGCWEDAITAIREGKP